MLQWLPGKLFRSGTSRGALFLAKDLDLVPPLTNPLLAATVEAGATEGIAARRDLICAHVIGSGHVYAATGE